MPDPLLRERALILGATIEVVALDGYREASVPRLCRRAGVPVEAFFECFADREHCFLAAFDHVVLRAALYVLDACRDFESWYECTRAGLLALLHFLDEEPFCARLVVVESFGVSTRVLWRRSRLLDRLVDAIDAGAGEADSDCAPPRAVARAIVSTAHSAIYEGVARGGSGRLISLHPPLMSAIVAPYLGEEAAREELALGRAQLAKRR